MPLPKPCFQIVSIAGHPTRCPTTGDPATPGTMRNVVKPSDGLEPSTPSLPWRIQAAPAEEKTALDTALSLQFGPVHLPGAPFLEAP